MTGMSSSISMKWSGIWLLAAVIGCGFALPALADEGSEDSEGGEKTVLKISPEQRSARQIITEKELQHDLELFEAYNLPELGDISSATISLEEEKKLGRQWLQSLRSSAPIVEDTLIQSYAESLLRRLAETSELQDRDLTIVVLLDQAINAFAVPGGIIGINTGLLVQARSEGELAAVLTHELAHLSQRHHSRRIKSSRISSIAGLVLILSSILATASGGSTDAGIAAIYAGTAALQANQLSFSRRDEREADRIGMRNLVRANYHPLNASRMFETLNNSGSTSRPPEYLITHPYTENRIADMRARAQQLQDSNSGNWMFDRPIFQIISMRAQLLESPPLQETLLQYEFELKNASGTDRLALIYGLAYLYSKSGNADKALRLIDDLGKLDSSGVATAFALLRGEILLNSGRNAEALAWLNHQNNLQTNHYALTALHAKALTANRQYDEAEQQMRTLRTLHADKPLVWQQLAEMQLLVGDTLAYHRSSARYEELSGRYLRALKHLKEALRIAQNEKSGQLEQVIGEEQKRMQVLTQQAGFY